MAQQSALAIATSSIPGIKASDGFILTEPFLAVCRLVLPIVGEAQLIIS